MHCHLMVYLKIVLTTLVTLTCLLGDNFVELTQHPLLKALADNATHATIGALTGIAFAMQFYERTTNLYGWIVIFTCFMISSFIDLDHFIEARSFYLEDATSLQHRPFLHCSSIIFFIFVIYFSTACLNYFKTSLIFGSIICAFITHHARDAVRRGFWFCPFGHSERLPYVAYILITIITPYFIGYLHGVCRSTTVQAFLGQYIKLSNENGYRYLNV